MFDGSGIKEWLTGTGIVIVLLIGAMIAGAQWKAGGIRRVAEIVAITLLVAFLLAVITNMGQMGTNLFKLVFG